MFSNKTTFLLSYVEKCKYQKKKVIAFKPKKDNRYGDEEIVSHNGWKIPAHVIETGDDIIRTLASDDVVYDVIAIDELFMVPGAAAALVWAFRSGISVVASTLDLSSRCKSFAEVKKILPWATKIIKCTAVCEVCGADARYTHMKADLEGTGEIFVGGASEYEPRCAVHHPFFHEATNDIP